MAAEAAFSTHDFVAQHRKAQAVDDAFPALCLCLLSIVQKLKV
jgi:hypothetical protein